MIVDVLFSLFLLFFLCCFLFFPSPSPTFPPPASSRSVFVSMILRRDAGVVRLVSRLVSGPASLVQLGFGTAVSRRTIVVDMAGVYVIGRLDCSYSMKEDR